ncbi:U-box domain-containing protein 34-like [Dorcoceras hygrometricum]|uniref:U-box domain-containing protein 34-like n=1 Tax=Dorcoceras hygrometricum TaxID=472368 RepID=A0A2Z7BPB6_9LAMI|nr:U-box domain-containing protein 34-like [Dorcoceras hygrometricum]
MVSPLAECFPKHSSLTSPTQIRTKNRSKKRNKSCSGAGEDSDSDFSSVHCSVIPTVRTNCLWNNLTTFYSRIRAAAALRMKQIAPDNQSRMIRRLRAKLATERQESAALKKEHESTQTRDSHQECHHKWQARIQAAEDTIQEQHLIIEALVEEKASLLQTIQGLQEDNGAPAPFDDEWEEEPEEDPEEEGLEDIPIGEGEIVDE